MDAPQMTDTYTYVIDIDGTICNTTGMDYENSTPILERIEQINILYDLGHKIIFLTARGMGRNGNSYELATNQFFDLTSSQLKKWGCKYHELCFKGHNGDYFIDDRGINAEDFFE